jgi:hypothetical protein
VLLAYITTLPVDLINKPRKESVVAGLGAKASSREAIIILPALEVCIHVEILALDKEDTGDVD